MSIHQLTLFNDLGEPNADLVPHKCKHGHRLTPENTLVRWRKGKPYRQCRQCYQDGQERQKAKRRAAFRKPRKRCALEGCGRPSYQDAICAMHFYRREHGIPLDAPVLGRGKFARSVNTPCSYNAAHSRCTRVWGSASAYPCVECGLQAEHWAYDGTDPEEITGHQRGATYVLIYSRYPEFYMPLCRKCHGPHDTSWRRELARQFAEFREWKQAAG